MKRKWENRTNSENKRKNKNCANCAVCHLENHVLSRNEGMFEERGHIDDRAGTLERFRETNCIRPYYTARSMSMSTVCAQFPPFTVQIYTFHLSNFIFNVLNK